MNITKLNTEQRNPKTMEVDLMTTEEIITIINQEDAIVPNAIAREIPHIVKVVDEITDSFKKGGRLIYVGAGTSGRLGIIDASECPPTYGTDPEMVVGIIAGGKEAMTEAVEGAEDDSEQGRQDVADIQLSDKDVLVGIAASGRTPYTIGALQYGNEVGAVTVAVACTKDSEMGRIAKYTIAPITGPEVVTGSTRMKAGTAQKLVLNMLTTASMIKLGKVYGNLMVDVQMTNEKLFKRAENIVKMATGASDEEAQAALKEQNHNTKAAILQILTGLKGEAAARLLKKHNGYLREAIAEYHTK
ncbi:MULTISPECIES: N-acetylmuramic acid 6-phosphate etherase [Cytobacillus]|jgi:N-acetylmuramic acid 6-phosphate etherase|uniref:N-acetylmuramic acid 6-phosphate etherase n=1 Tax=Cytobacillus TaxID=2675230 RepID=UPI00203A8904|nr:MULTISPECIES: N-acetylmuramic acid 6-phosphate etherase [Cytobacillus]MCM3395214.1 N-acetylmuramic acid 6-phosphate etherase [Cytobacillus oceanisediminis]MCM3401932.1 N-acetylmuramic acid 6-phosphate etherase [Cytobacillus oceanisediminis]MCM3529192.1 N-acetylmuramic acid 6-phosphate etherase [Cytobacillus oceanisediminis]MDK7666912.1 N-acetylmuramic acid 6-phosphate etherase [Cytobacillus oceanisediminis]UQX53884.1 N-acetylmuramic acid 6-phosphate etherase [Cytobacillus pseudoceanisedimin